MEWRDQGVIIGLRRHGETSVILEAMTAARGRHLGLVRGGRSRRLAPVLQPGNSVELVWRARLDEHLGMFQVEPTVLRAARIIDSALALSALNTVTTHLRLLSEREAHAALYDTLLIILDHLGDIQTVPALLARFEQALLSELGFGLDLGACAVTGQHDDLIWVSPRSGRAVSRGAGAPYADRLLPLPAFMHVATAASPDDRAIRDALRITGFFLTRHVYEPRGLSMPEARAQLLALVDSRLQP